MASPSPPPTPPSRSPAAVYLRNSWPRWSGAMPRPSSATETATCSPSRSRHDPDGGRFRRVAPGVGQQVVEHLHRALPVGHDPGQAGRQVDADGVPPAAADERAAGLVHQRGDIRGLGRDRQRPGFDAPGVEQVANQVVHAVGLLVDDAEELRHLGRTEDARGAEHRGGRALDRGQRRPQLVAHHAQELGPHALQLPKRRQVLHGDHHPRRALRPRRPGRGSGWR